MSITIEFTKQEKDHLIKTWAQSKIAGKGTESICYQIDDYVYKVLNDYYRTIYNQNSIYNEDINLKSFLFPEEIYISDNKIFAYKTKYIENKIDKKRIYAGVLPDINKLRDALPTFIKDIYILSQDNILTVDIAWKNILFDGEKLYAIDTMHYTRDEDYSWIDTYKWNISKLQITMFEFTKVYQKACINKGITLSEEKRRLLLEIPYYIGEIAKQVQEEYKDKEVQKIKR